MFWKETNWLTISGDRKPELMWQDLEKFPTDLIGVVKMEELSTLTHKKINET